MYPKISRRSCFVPFNRSTVIRYHRQSFSVIIRIVKRAEGEKDRDYVGYSFIRAIHARQPTFLETIRLFSVKSVYYLNSTRRFIFVGHMRFSLTNAICFRYSCSGQFATKHSASSHARVTRQSLNGKQYVCLHFFRYLRRFSSSSNVRLVVEFLLPTIFYAICYCFLKNQNYIVKQYI